MRSILIHAKPLETTIEMIRNLVYITDTPKILGFVEISKDVFLKLVIYEFFRNFDNFTWKYRESYLPRDYIKRESEFKEVNNELTTTFRIQIIANTDVLKSIFSQEEMDFFKLRIMKESSEGWSENPHSDIYVGHIIATSKSKEEIVKVLKEAKILEQKIKLLKHYHHLFGELPETTHLVKSKEVVLNYFSILRTKLILLLTF
jgi:hypothetical protein